LGGMNWIDLAEDREQWRSLVNMVMNLRVPKKMLGSSLVAAQLAASQEGLSSMSESEWSVILQTGKNFSHVQERMDCKLCPRHTAAITCACWIILYIVVYSNLCLQL
jgi:hypothetical protein